MKIPQVKEVSATGSGFIHDSTREFFRLHGWKNLPRFLNGYLYFSRLGSYIKLIRQGPGLLRNLFPRALMNPLRPLIAYLPDRYHGKVISFDDAEKLVTLKTDVRVSKEKSEKVIPYKFANQIIIRNPEAIAVLDCPCRSNSKNPCLPLSVCFIIGEPYVSFVIEHDHALNPRRISQEEALKILKDCHQRGWVHNAYFRDVAGDQLYAICNCCRCCCTGIISHGLFRSLPLSRPVNELLPSGYTMTVSTKDCLGCGACITRCPFQALALNDNYAVVNRELCMGCGVCADFCPAHALKLERDPDKGIPLDIHELAPESRPQPKVPIKKTGGKHGRQN